MTTATLHSLNFERFPCSVLYSRKTLDLLSIKKRFYLIDTNEPTRAGTGIRFEEMIICRLRDSRFVLYINSLCRSESKKMRVTFAHLDLGIGGAERLVVDAGVALQKAGHRVEFITSHHDQAHCFPETREQLPVTVSIWYRSVPYMFCQL